MRMGKGTGQKYFSGKKPRLKLIGIACLMVLLGGAVASAAAELEASKAGTHVDGIEYYVALDGGWQRIASDTTVPGKDTIAGAARYYTTPSALEEYYGAFGFQAEKYDGERVFPHSAGLDTEQIWADMVSVQDGDGEWKIPLATKDKIYVYYLPDNIEGSSSYFNKNKRLDDETTLNANMFYSVIVSDPDGKAPEVQDVTYVRSGHSYEVALPTEDGYGWECVNNHTFDTVKYEHSDGWHVDGILVAKAGKIVVKKTFAGSADAAITKLQDDDFNITVSYPDDAPQSSYQTVELKNTYVSSSFITLDKLDAFTVDGMKDVMFKVNKLGAQDDDASFQLYRRTDANAYGDEYDKM